MKSFLKSFTAIVLIIFLFWLLALVRAIKPQPEKSFGLHYGANQTTQFFDDAYKNVSKSQPSDPIAGITVNHHLLAANLIAQEFSLVATDKPVTVVLVSPNHFFRGDGGVITSKFDWQTPYGVLKTNQNLIDKLAQEGLVNVDERPFDQEHGINNIVGFIKKSLPNANFIPIIIKENLSDEKVDALAAALPKDALIVGSLDFSHYLTSNAAEFHDQQTLSVIHNFDYNRIPKLDIDSHPGLRLILKYFDLREDKRFVLTADENSSTVTGDYSFVETTSYIDGYFTLGANQPDNLHIELFISNLDPKIPWTPETSQRLVQYNDSIITQLPPELANMKLGTGPMAVGLVYKPNLTDVYLIPLDVSTKRVTLLPIDKADKILIQLGLTEHTKIK